MSSVLAWGDMGSVWLQDTGQQCQGLAVPGAGWMLQGSAVAQLWQLLCLHTSAALLGSQCCSGSALPLLLPFLAGCSFAKRKRAAVEVSPSVICVGLWLLGPLEKQHF